MSQDDEKQENIFKIMSFLIYCWIVVFVTALVCAIIK